MGTITLGFVGAGRRAHDHLGRLYMLRDREYLLGDRADGHPERIYHEYGGTVPWWAEDVSDLTPEVTAVFDPSEEATTSFRGLCGGGHTAGDDLSGRWLDYRDRWSDLPPDPPDDPATFGTFEAFLEEGEYDAAVVVSPNDAHVDSVVPLLEKGIDVLCAKPLATTLGDHDRIAAAAEDSAARLVSGFNLRTHPFYRRLGELREEVGDLGMITCQEVREPLREGYRYSGAPTGGTLLEKNVHDFDLFNWLTGADPVTVSAFGGQQQISRNTDSIDHATVIVEYGNGVKATLELCLYAPFGQRGRTYELRGSEGVLRSPAETRNAVDLYARGTHDRFEADGGYDESNVVLLRNFLRIARGEERPQVSPGDAKKAAAIAIGAQRAIEAETIVDIDPEYDVHPR